jgi:DnaJ family protein C protein 11
LREENRDLIKSKKEEAQDAISVMERPTAIKTAEERANKGNVAKLVALSDPGGYLCWSSGLIIVSAHYGRGSAFTDRGLRDNGQEEVVMDVTVPVQALVIESRLYIPGGRGKVSQFYSIFVEN